MSSPGRRRALRALGKRRHSNLRRVAAGKSPRVHGKSGKLVKTSAKKLGLTKAKAKRRLKALRKRG